MKIDQRFKPSKSSSLIIKLNITFASFRLPYFITPPHMHPLDIHHSTSCLAGTQSCQWTSYWEELDPDAPDQGWLQLKVERKSLKFKQHLQRTKTSVLWIVSNKDIPTTFISDCAQGVVFTFLILINAIQTLKIFYQLLTGVYLVTSSSVNGPWNLKWKIQGSKSLQIRFLV